MLAEVKGDSKYKSNLYGFVVDEHAANWSSIEEVFGPETVWHRTVSRL